MSHIWTQCEPRFEFGSIERSVVRVVEAQHENSTRKLVDTLEEQEILEAAIESAKPPIPLGVDSQLHYLLWTPFRYPPLDFGSRFAGVMEPSLWYGSFEAETAFAEKAYYRWKFLDDTDAHVGHVQVELTLFSARIKSKKVADLSRKLFRRFYSQILNKNNLKHAQSLGAALRSNGTEVIKYPSVRDPNSGINVGLFTSKPFIDRLPLQTETWTLLISKLGTEASFRRLDPIAPQTFTFTRSAVGLG